MPDRHGKLRQIDRIPFVRILEKCSVLHRHGTVNFQIEPLLHPRLQRFDRPQLRVDPECQGGTLRRIDRITEHAKSGWVSGNPVEQQRRAFRQTGRDLGDPADLQVGMRAVNMSKQIDPFDFSNEPAQVLVNHRLVLPGNLIMPLDCAHARFEGHSLNADGSIRQQRKWRHPCAAEDDQHHPSADTLLLGEIMRLEQIAAGLRRERAVVDARRTDAVGGTFELLAASAICVRATDQVALDEEDLFPIFMNEWDGRKRAGLDAQNPRPVADPVLLVEGAGQDPLREAGRIAWNLLKTLFEIEGREFHVALVVAHQRPSLRRPVVVRDASRKARIVLQ
jgi:hypothetical protein